MSRLGYFIKFPSFDDSKSLESFEFGEAPRTVTVTVFKDSFVIQYTDQTLMSKQTAWDEAQKAAAMQQKQKALKDL